MFQTDEIYHSKEGSHIKVLNNERKVQHTKKESEHVVLQPAIYALIAKWYVDIPVRASPNDNQMVKEELWSTIA